MLIEDAKVKELVYYGNTVIFLLPNRECMRENSFFWSPSQLITFCSISSAFLIDIAFFGARTIWPSDDLATDNLA